MRTPEQITADITDTVRKFNAALAVARRTERFSCLDQGLISGISDEAWEFGEARAKREELLHRARELAFEALEAGMDKRTTLRIFGSMAEWDDVGDVLA